jgi:hypothetical protein
MIKNGLIGAVLLAAAASAFAAEWAVVYRWADGVLSVDRSRLHRSGSYINGWFRMDYSKPIEDNGVTSTALVDRLTIDCSTLQWTMTSSFTYNGESIVRQWQGPPGSFSDVPPDTPFEKGVEILCRS